MYGIFRDFNFYAFYDVGHGVRENLNYGISSFYDSLWKILVL